MNLAFNKENTEITNIEEAKREYRKAEYLDNIGHIHKSIEYFKKAIELDPENEAYQSKLENVIKERSDEEYQKAILLENQRKYLDAINHCEEAMIINPDNKEYKNKLNILKEKYSGQKEAKPYYEKAVKLEEEGKLKKSIKYCDKAIKVDPYEINYYKTKGNCLFNIKSLFKKNYKKSMECYDKLIELEPDNSYFYSRKAECLEKLGRNEEAKEYYDAAKKNDKK